MKEKQNCICPRQTSVFGGFVTSGFTSFNRSARASSLRSSGYRRARSVATLAPTPFSTHILWRKILRLFYRAIKMSRTAGTLCAMGSKIFCKYKSISLMRYNTCIGFHDTAKLRVTFYIKNQSTIQVFFAMAGKKHTIWF
jgi:hypothetical protein